MYLPQAGSSSRAPQEGAASFPRCPCAFQSLPTTKKHQVQQKMETKRQRRPGQSGRAAGRDAARASLPRGAVINLRLPTPWGLPMNHLKGEEEVELRLITRYQPGGCACRVHHLQSLGASQSWALIAAITAKRGWGLFACFAHDLWGEVLNL